MKDNRGREAIHPCFNLSIDYQPLSIRFKQPMQKEKIRIVSKKFPFDFFRPHTRELYNQDIGNKGNTGNETPVFGQNPYKSTSITLIPKIIIYPAPFIHRVDTLPDLPHQTLQVLQKQQYSSRLYQDSKVSHKSMQRQFKKYKKKNSEKSSYIEDNEKSGKKRKNEQKIRLNQKKFFKADSLENTFSKCSELSSKDSKFSHKGTPRKLPPIM